MGVVGLSLKSILGLISPKLEQKFFENLSTLDGCAGTFADQPICFTYHQHGFYRNKCKSKKKGEQEKHKLAKVYQILDM